MRIVWWMAIRMKYHTLFFSKIGVPYFFRKSGNMLKNLSSAAVVIVTLRVNSLHAG